MTRRKRGDGTVYKRKDGRYEIQYFANTTAGVKRVSRYAHTRKDVTLPLNWTHCLS